MPKALNSILILGEPQSRRVKLFQSSLRNQGYPVATSIGYSDFISSPALLTGQLNEKTILRIESPGENPWVERLLVNLGAQLHAGVDAEKIKSTPIQHGQIYYPNLSYYGFQSVLAQLPPLSSFSEMAEGPFVFNSVNNILTMFDKSLSHQYLQQSGVNVPRSLLNIYSYDELISEMDAHDLSRVFVKLRHASSASGCIALAVNKKQNQLVAYSTVEISNSGEGIKLFNSLRPKVYKDVESVRSIIDALARYELQVEQWIPKGMTNGGYTYDLRIVVIGHSVKQSVARLSKHPITNLHLGNLRNSLSDLSLSEVQKQDINDIAVQVSHCFSGSAYMGIDIALPRNSKPVVIEVNAFGDLLPNLLYKGLTTYESEIMYMKEKLVCRQ